MKLLNLRILSPEKEERYSVRHLSVEDVCGSLGIYPGHIDYITVLPRSVGYFTDITGKKMFLAYDYGILSVKDDEVLLITRTAITGENLGVIKDQLDKMVERVEVYEKRLRENIKTLEKMILKEIIEVERE